MQNLLTPAEVALQLIAKGIHVTPATVRSYADKGRLSVIRTARGARLFNQRDVERFAADRMARKTTGNRVSVQR